MSDVASAAPHRTLSIERFDLKPVSFPHLRGVPRRGESTGLPRTSGGGRIHDGGTEGAADLFA